MTAPLSAELQAMAQIEAALQGLDEEVRARVILWVNARYRGGSISSRKPLPPSEEGETNEPGTYETLAEFYDAARPSTDADKVLVVSYWYQFRENATDVESQKVNTDLKHLGHGVGNVTRAFEALKATKPALIIQTRKEGTTKQARKRYKVTGEGKKAVERLVSRPHAD
jgi:hypothetical protein